LAGIIALERLGAGLSVSSVQTPSLVRPAEGDPIALSQDEIERRHDDSGAKATSDPGHDKHRLIRWLCRNSGRWIARAGQSACLLSRSDTITYVTPINKAAVPAASNTCRT